MTEFTYYKDGSPQDPEEVARIQRLRELAQEQAAQQSAFQVPSGMTVQSNPFSKYIFLFFLLLFFIPAGVFGYKFLGKTTEIQQTTEEEGDVKGVSDAQEENTVDAAIKDKIFFVQDGNVFIAEKTGKNKEQITSYTDVESIESLTLIDADTLGFFSCGGEDGTLVCRIKKLNISTKSEETVEQFVPGEVLTYVAWANADSFAYTLKDTARNVIRLVYRSDSSEITLFSYEVNATSRLPFIEDDREIAFSPSGQHLYYIDTIGKSGFDFTVYVFDVTGTKLDEVTEATMPVWLSDDEIIYRRYSNSDPGHLYKRNIEQRMSDELMTPNAAYEPQVAGKKMVYWEASGSGGTYVYNLGTGRNAQIDKNTAFPIWISDSELIYAKVRECQEGECVIGTVDNETQFTPYQYALKNINTEISEGIDIDPEVLRDGFVSWYHRHQ